MPDRRRSTTLTSFLKLSMFLFLVAACSSGAPAKTVYTVITSPTLKPGDKIPRPTKDVIITVSGKIGTANSGNTIVMDVPTIEMAGQVDYKVNDPFLKADVVFRGVLMSSLLDLWKASPDATQLHIWALDDYVVDIPLSEIRKYPVILALQQDGAYMPISTRGPSMLVFPYNDFKFDHAVYDSYWAWQIKKIEVR